MCFSPAGEVSYGTLVSTYNADPRCDAPGDLAWVEVHLFKEMELNKCEPAGLDTALPV